MQVMEDLRPRIQQLQELQGDDLTGAMKELKKALKENPAAVELLLPEDIGLMVTALRQVTGEAITSAAASKGKKEKAKPLTAAELEAAFNEL